jgi:hypothetical protein
MPKRTIIFLTLTAVSAVTAIAASMATALPSFLPANERFPVKFTSFSGSGTLATASGGVISCRKDTDTGEILSETTIDVTVDFKECFTIFEDLPVWSLGDPSDTILISATGTLCYINKTNREVGITLTPTGKLHLETKVGKLFIVAGALIGRLTPVNTQSLEGHLILEQTRNGEQKVLKCEGGSETHLTTEENENGRPEDSSEATTDTTGYLVTTVELMA